MNREGDGRSEPGPGGSATAPAARLEPGSFRDPDSTVFYANGSVFRALSERGLEDWRALASTRLFSDFVAAGKLVATEPLDGPARPPALRTQESAAVLRHEAIPFVSYVYEWTPGMLQDAALLQLDLLMAALDEDMTLKEATPYNVQWRGGGRGFVERG